MRGAAFFVAVIGLLAVDVAAMPVEHPFGINGFALPGGSSTVAAAWRRDTQVLTIDSHNTLLFWDTPSHRLIDSITIGELPTSSSGSESTRRVGLRVSPDGRRAAVTVRSIDCSTTTALIDLVAHKVTATLDRPALFWSPAGLVAGPRAGCTAACDFAVIEPQNGQAIPVGIGFGDGDVVAAVPDGSRFATVVQGDGRRDFVVWSTATWTAIARTSLSADALFEIGFDHAGNRAFARQSTQVTALSVPDGAVSTSALASRLAAKAFASDLDTQQMMTAKGPVAFTQSFEVARSGGFKFYSPDPRGAIFDYDDGASAAIGALPAKPNAFPWQVELQYRAPPDSYFSAVTLHNCGGSLIRPGWVVTATHCFLTADNLLRSDEEAREHTVVRAGSVELDRGMTSFDVVGVYMRRCSTAASTGCFRDYDPDGRPPSPPRDDITLLHIVPHGEAAVRRTFTSQPAGVGEIRPIRLPAAKSEVVAPRPVTMTGWGATSAANAQDHTMSPLLNRIDITVMPRAACSSHHGFGPLSTGVICAGSANDAQLACKGDSGGPLVADIDTKPVLVGIVSWGSCNGGPAVYTNVAAFVPWINATIAAAEARR